MSDNDVVAVYEAINRINQVILRPEVRLRFLGPDLTSTSVGDVLLLRALAQVGPIRPSDLAAFQGVDKSTISPQLARLDEAGMITRRADPDDGRASLVRLSAKGRGLLRRIQSRASSIYAQATGDWPDADVAALAELTTRFAESFEELVARES